MLGEHQGEHGGEGVGHDQAADQAEAGDGGLEGARVRGAGAGPEQQEVLHQCAGDETEAAAGLCKNPGAGSREENPRRPKDYQVFAVVNSSQQWSTVVNSSQQWSTVVISSNQQ